ncbi:hypothetical protein Glove_139g313 [Diversispora epigaea]|uniref:Protein kinase domain-containing protein n=1 Tax=Diversispora epigaea TaxID=1348612 RepID=A0A397IZZ4_9GLOM|nr:hypothetical protein Glove_139g313 [Diversispora epigaea]
MMVLDYAKDGNLREYLKINFNNIDWKKKLHYLWSLSYRLKNIHKLDIVHQDFHPGNILSSNFNISSMEISDFGLSKLTGANPNNPEKKNIFGVLPYIAPEVLSGDEEYTKAADVYSFGIIAYEMITGFPPYPDIPHDEDLAIKICNGLRPKIPFHTPKLITRVIMRCWDARVTHRPTFKELSDELDKYWSDYNNYLRKGKNKDSKIVIQIKKAEEFSANQESINATTTTTTTPLNYQTHPQAIYTSRLLNYPKLPKPKNEENFERELEELTKSFSHINTNRFVQDAQLNASHYLDVIEWIPYDRFKDVKQIGKGGFGTIHYARWIDGYIREWDIENQQWKRWDPETHSYMMVLDYAKDGNLREYLKINFNNIDWKKKLHYLWSLSYRLKNIHKLDIVHQDFHPGNILSSNFNISSMEISDFGLSKLTGANPNNPEKKNIFGVLPYIAPEVLSGDEEYTKAADVYSFGIIAYEMITGFPPYPDIPHDEDLAIKICNGLRPKIPFHTPKLITRVIMRCWDARVTHRPTFKELSDELDKYWSDYNNYLRKGKNKDSKIVIQIKKAEEFSANQESINATTTTTTTPLNYQTHPQAIYTSRLLNYPKLPKPKNEENFERELEELTKSFSHINTNDDIDEF